MHPPMKGPLDLSRCYPVHLFKSRYILLVCPLFAFRNSPIAQLHRASELQSREDPHFKGIPRPNFRRTRESGPDQLHTTSSLNWIAHMGYIDEEMDCGTCQNFGAFRPQTIYGPACTSGSNPFTSQIGAVKGCHIDCQCFSNAVWLELA